MATQPFDYSQIFGQAIPPGMTTSEANPAAVFNPDWTTGDPGKQTIQNRTYEAAWGDQQQQYNAGQQNYYNGLAGAYTNAANVEGENIGATPGYTDQELQNILQTPQYQSGETTADQYAALNPTAAQTQAMMGDTGSYFNYLNPTSVNSALNPAELTVPSTYLNSLEGAYNTHAGTVNSAVNNPNLQLNLAPNDYLMGNQELQDIQTEAGRAVQQQVASQNEEYQRAAAASGNSDPLAVAALKQQNAAQGDEAAANAETEAYLNAMGQKRQLAMNYAQANLGAAQTQAGMQVSGAENLLGQQLGAAQNYEAMNLGANQYLANAQLGALGNLTNIQETADTTNAGRAAQLYNTQLQNAMYQQQNQFNQNTAITDRQSQAYQAAANARMGGQNQFLNWATGQANANTNASLGYGQLNNQAQGTAFNGINNSTNTGANWGMNLNNNSFGANLARGFGNFVGSLPGASRGNSSSNSNS